MEVLLHDNYDRRTIPAMPSKLITTLIGFAKLAIKSNEAAHAKELPDVFIHLHDWNEAYRVTPAPRVSYKFPLKVKITVYYLHLESNTKIEVDF
jgi:hypothetical protein